MLNPLTSPARALELRVLTGRQAGARARLDAQDDRLVCGRDATDGDDTQLADILLSSDAEFQARLVPSGPGRISVQLLGGTALLGERALESGTTLHAWMPGQPLQFGDTVIAYGPADEAHWPEPVLHDAPEPPAADPAPGPRKPATPPPRRTAVTEGLLAALGLVMLVGGSVVAWQGGTLREAGQALARVVPPAQAATPRAPADLMANAVDVFRLHGIAAQGNWSPEGELVLQTRERDTAKLQAAVAAAKRDVARLPALRVDNQPPATATAAPQSVDDPAKRLVAVVDNTDTPYFITADGSRYFSGALLPSGHRVVEIAERMVVVERDGQQLRLTL